MSTCSRREFPADGAAGEGFTNAAEALTDISPALLTKYLNAAKEIADHAVLLPDGFRFSPTKTRRDWTDESLTQLRKFYAPYAPEGRLPFQPYLLATVRHRDALIQKKINLDEVAAKEKLSAKYLQVLWQTLTDTKASQPLDQIRQRWRQGTERDVPALVAEITAWQTALWKVVAIGSYRYGDSPRQVANNPAPTATQSLRFGMKPVPGQSDVVLYLQTHEMGLDAKNATVVWQRPRFEGGGKPPLLLKDYAQFGPAYEIDFPTAFADTTKYLAAAVEVANDRTVTAQDVANKHELNAAFLKRWIDVVAVEPYKKTTEAENPGRVVPTVTLTLLGEKTVKNGDRPEINGWHKKGTDLPVLVSNSSDKVQQIPGRVSAHGVAVHPLPKEFVAVAWKSPIGGQVRVTARIAHAHPACGNGVAWWISQRREDNERVFDEGEIALGGEAKPTSTIRKVAKGDQIVLAVDAKNGDHTCDLTEISLTLSEIDKPGRIWDLAADIADAVLTGNPHADKQGNKDTWSFVAGPTRPIGKAASIVIPGGSLLGKWREAAADPSRRAESDKLAEQTKSLLTGPRPMMGTDPNRLLYDNFVSVQSPLLIGLDLRPFRKTPDGKSYGIAKELFNKTVDRAGLAVPANAVTEVRLPAALFRDREFVVDGGLESATDDRVVQFQVTTSPNTNVVRWDGKSPVVASASGTGFKQLVQGYDEFRRCFPLFVCFPVVVPVDEAVSLKMFHREDEQLNRLFLDETQKQRLDHLWSEHRFISQQPLAENNYLPQFIGFVTQDQPKELLAYFEGQRPVFKKRAEEFEQDLVAAIPKQMDRLLEFAGRAYRRPLQEKEKAGLNSLYQALRSKGAPHEEAFRGVLARVLVAPAFLFRVEQAPAGSKAALVNDWELATRLSYFLWSSAPDEELRRLAQAGTLQNPKVMAEQVRRMVKDDRLRALAIEFGTQWLHVRGFDEFNEKNEKLFPTFDATLRKAIYEESILFFQDLFQNDRALHQVLDADYTYLNEALAKHYGIPGVSGPQWRRVDGVRQYGRGGILGLASIQAKQAGASRTSPVLRGNWVVETLLGEKLPRPPANVPKLPEEENGADLLTMRQQVEKHARARSAPCAISASTPSASPWNATIPLVAGVTKTSAA